MPFDMLRQKCPGNLVLSILEYTGILFLYYGTNPDLLRRRNDLCLLSAVSPIPEVSPSKEQQDIADMCQQLTQGLSALATDDSFIAATNGTPMNDQQHARNFQGMFP